MKVVASEELNTQVAKELKLPDPEFSIAVLLHKDEEDEEDIKRGAGDTPEGS